ncbi:hypothetical protein ACIG3E_27605 [Streptomyces sp. NPDC053474]|uniref:hypothetical protein n=1 Tax=Streptomyces sp. NPDC053474 TaxID=3365704 RepID=UPI0037D21B29
MPFRARNASGCSVSVIPDSILTSTALTAAVARPHLTDHPAVGPGRQAAAQGRSMPEISPSTQGGVEPVTGAP